MQRHNDPGDTAVQYLTSTEIENCLKGVASEIADTANSPFRVDIVAQYGGKSPLYTVVMRSAEKEPIRRKLPEMLNRTCRRERQTFFGRPLHAGTDAPNPGGVLL
jgi:hypothetical protein